MDEPTTDNLVRRLKRLERENRRWRLLGSASVVSLSLILLVAATESEESKIEDEIRARRFILVDKDGKDLGELGPGMDGSPRLNLRGKTGETSLIVDTKGPRLSLWSQDKLSKVGLTVEGDGSPRLSFSRNSVPRVVLIAGADGPSLALYDQREVPRAVLGSTSLTARRGTVTRRPEASLVLFNEGGKAIWRTPLKMLRR